MKKDENLDDVQVAEGETGQDQQEIDLSDVYKVEEESPTENQGSEVVEPVAVEGIDIAGMGVELGTAYLIARKGSHWAMTPPEREKLSEIIGALATKYGASGSVSPEVALIIFGVTFAAPRIMQDMMNVEEPEKIEGGGDVGDLSTHGN